MNTLFVTYALDDAVESYSKISSKLKRYPDWVKLFNRAWIIKQINHLVKSAMNYLK